MEQPILLEVIRGDLVESRHRGAVAVVEPDGSVIRSVGTIDTAILMRSTGKPFQMVPAVRSGILEHFGFTSEELAIMVASHSGEPYHTYLVESILAKGGLDVSQLRCGAHLPKDPGAQRALRETTPSVLHNNCSGQHAGLLAYCLFIGAETGTYEAPEHALHQRMLSTLAEFSGIPAASIPSAVDGCSLPVFAIPLRGLARGYAGLVNPSDFDDQTQSACSRIVRAMLEYPQAVAGSAKRLCTDLMTSCAGRLIAKTGAEGVYSIGVLPCEAYGNGLGIAIKIEDGAERALGPVVVETLAQLGLLAETEERCLHDWRIPQIRNHNGGITGHMKPVFHLAGG
jgi:L-asparaginase II